MFKDYFFGNKISEYGRKNGYVDYATLAKSFDAVLNNGIIEATADIGFWDIIHGLEPDTDAIEALEADIEAIEAEIEALEDADADAEKIAELEAEADAKREEIDELNEEPYTKDVFQYYIISESGAEILKQYTHEIIAYNEALDMYVWEVTHYGTSWSYVLTDIPCEIDEDANA